MYVNSAHEVFQVIQGVAKKIQFAGGAIGKEDMPFVIGLTVLRDGRIWALTAAGLYELRGDIFQYFLIPGLPAGEDYYCSEVIESDSGIYFNLGKAIFFAKKGERAKLVVESTEELGRFQNVRVLSSGLYALSGKMKVLFKITDNKLLPVKNDMLSGQVIRFSGDSHGGVWFSLLNGIFYLPRGAKWEDKLVSIGVKDSFYKIFEDKSGVLWFAADAKLLRVQVSPVDKIDAINKNGLLIPGTRERDLRFLTPGGIFQINNQPFHLSHSRALFFKEKVVEEFRGYVEDSSGLWISSLNHLWHIKNGSAQQVKYNNFKTPDPEKPLFSIAQDKACNKIILGSYDLLYGDQNGFETLKLDSNIHDFYSIVPVDDDRFLVSTLKKGVFIISKKGKCININKELGLSNLLLYNPNNLPSTIVKDPGGGFWLSNTDGVLVKFSIHGQFIKIGRIFSEKDGLMPGFFAVSIVFDQDNRLWVNGFNGLYLIDQKPDFVINRINVKVQLDMLLWTKAQLVSQGGFVYMFTGKEIIKFNAREFLTREEVYSPILEKVQIVGSGESSDSLKNASYSGFYQIPDRLKLSHQQNTVIIQVNSPVSAWNGNTLFSYKLEGFSNKWSTPSSDRSFIFAGLSPGNYTFMVKTIVNNRDCPKPAKFSFYVAPPFWKYGWFKVLIVFSAISLLMAFYIYRVKKIKKSESVKNQLLDLEMKALKSQINPHFIYNALNSIQSLVLEREQHDALRYIGKFSRLLRLVLEQSQDRLYSLERELSVLEYYVEIERLRVDYDFRYEVEVAPEVDLTVELIPPLILQPFVENSLWHGLGNCTGEKYLKIKVSIDGGWLVCEIIDNGRGRVKAGELSEKRNAKKKSMGIEITRKRLETINGTGYRSIHVIDLADDGGATGTHVTVRIKRLVAKEH
jgi:hypothetical protein